MGFGKALFEVSNVTNRSFLRMIGDWKLLRSAHDPYVSFAFKLPRDPLLDCDPRPRIHGMLAFAGPRMTFRNELNFLVWQLLNGWIRLATGRFAFLVVEIDGVEENRLDTFWPVGTL